MDKLESLLDASQFSHTYDRPEPKYLELEAAVKAFSSVLEACQGTIATFQRDLQHASNDIQLLQKRSRELDVRLANTQSVESLLAPIIKEYAISPALAVTIARGPLDQAWVDALEELEQRLLAARAKEDKESESESQDAAPELPLARTAQPLLRNLKLCALVRCRDHLVEQIKAMRRPLANTRVIQQVGLLRYKAMYRFLFMFHETLALEIRTAYCHTMSWYYLAHLNAFVKMIEQLPVRRGDVIGTRTGASRNIIGGLFGSQAAETVSDDGAGNTWGLASRTHVFTERDPSAGIIMAHMTQTQQGSHAQTLYYVEEMYNAFTTVFIDNAVAEFTFTTEMFGLTRHDTMQTVFDSIFRQSVQLAQSYVSAHLLGPQGGGSGGVVGGGGAPGAGIGSGNNSSSASAAEGMVDSVGVLLCIRLTQRLALELQRNRIPVLEAYVNGMLMTLWPRFQASVDAQGASLRRVKTTGGASAAAALSNDGVHAVVTQRMAIFIQSVAQLCADVREAEPVASSMERLRAEFEATLTRLSQHLEQRDSSAHAADRERFLYNQYALVHESLSDIAGRFAEEQRTHFESLLQAYSSR